MLTYRAEPGLDERHGRGAEPTEQSGFPFRVQGYLEHQGEKLRARFDARAYLAQLDVMDQHDVLRPPPGVTVHPLRASTLYLGVNTDVLFTAEQGDAYVAALKRNGAHVERATLKSPHGHDAFLIEWEALAPEVTRALALPVREALEPAQAGVA
jgi:homoserine O-acetyltransferase